MPRLGVQTRRLTIQTARFCTQTARESILTAPNCIQTCRESMQTAPNSVLSEINSVIVLRKPVLTSRLPVQPGPGGCFSPFLQF